MNESSEKGNEKSERELLEINQEILFRIRGFSRQTIEVSWITLALILLYLFILLIFFETKTKIDVAELGKATPLFILISTILNEGRLRIMEWAAVKRERREYEKGQREAKLRAEGEAKGIEKGRQEILKELQAKGVDISKIDSKPQE